MTAKKLLMQHPFDEALALTPRPAGAHEHGADAPCRYLGNTHAAYAMFYAAFNTGPTASQLGQWTAELDRLVAEKKAASRSSSSSASGAAR